MVDSYFLALETSQERGSLALGKNQKTLLLKEWPSDPSAKASHSESVHQHCLQALQELKISLSDLGLLIVDIGPGSFTGVRVGINFIRSLAYSLHLPVLPICSLTVLAHREFLKQQSVAEGILPSLGTEYYYAQYSMENGIWQELQTPQLKIGDQTAAKPRPWSAEDLANCAFSRPAEDQVSWKMLSPLYLRGSQAEEKMKRKDK